MKGKKAAQAANRRATEMASTVGELQGELEQARTTHRKIVNELEKEIRRLKAESLQRAGQIAAREVERQLAAKEEERRKRGLSDDITYGLLIQKDKFIRNACRYVSMTTGRQPSAAMRLVMAWCLDDDYAGVLNPADFIIKIGVPTQGWVARQLRQYQHRERRLAQKCQRENKIMAYSLDRAEEELTDQIHPDYRSWWYPPVQYAGLVVVDDEDAPEPEGTP